MKNAPMRPDNKKNQKPHTNTLETKTIRVKSWRNTFLSKKRTPAIAAIAAGFFIASIGSVASRNPETSLQKTDNANEAQPLTYPDNIPIESVQNASEDTSTSSTPPTSSNASNVRVETKIESHSSASTETSVSERSSVTVNGNQIPVPERGTYKQTFEDDTSKTTVRVRGNGNGISLHTKINSTQEDE